MGKLVGKRPPRRPRRRYMIIFTWFLGKLNCEDKRRVELAYDHGFVAAVFTFDFWKTRHQQSAASDLYLRQR